MSKFLQHIHVLVMSAFCIIHVIQAGERNETSVKLSKTSPHLYSGPDKKPISYSPENVNVVPRITQSPPIQIRNHSIKKKQKRNEETFGLSTPSAFLPPAHDNVSNSPHICQNQNLIPLKGTINGEKTGVAINAVFATPEIEKIVNNQILNNTTLPSPAKLLEDLQSNDKFVDLYLLDEQRQNLLHRIAHACNGDDYFDVVKILISKEVKNRERGVNYLLQDKDGNTAAHLAAQVGNESIYLLLRQREKVAQITNNDGKTPVDIYRELKAKQQEARQAQRARRTGSK